MHRDCVIISGPLGGTQGQSVKLTDDAYYYGSVSRILHWSMAVLFTWQLTGMILKNVLDSEVPLVGFWVGTHASTGTLLFLLILIRLGWALAQRPNRPAYAAGPLGRLAAAGHMLMYVLMLVVPTLGVLRMLGGDRPISLFGIAIRDGLEREIAWMTAPANAIHGILGWTLLVLIVGHVAMVILHRWWWRDETLSRMAGSRVSKLEA